MLIVYALKGNTSQEELVKGRKLSNLVVASEKEVREMDSGILERGRNWDIGGFILWIVINRSGAQDCKHP